MKPSAGLDKEELNALLIECFLETINTLPLATQGRLAVVNLILGTRKSAWQHLARETVRAEREEPLPEDQELLGKYPSPERIAMAREDDRILQPERIRDWLEELLSDEAEDDLLLILRTHATGKPLIDWVYEQNPHLKGNELVREYSRLRRRRSRLYPAAQGAIN